MVELGGPAGRSEKSWRDFKWEPNLVSERRTDHRGRVVENERKGDQLGGWGPVRPLVIWAKDGGDLNKGSHCREDR